MIIRIAGIRIRAEIQGPYLEQLKQGIRRHFPSFLSGEPSADFRLKVYPAARLPLQALLGKNDIRDLKKIVKMLEGRFPFGKIPLPAGSGSAACERTDKGPESLFAPYLNAFEKGKISVIPHKYFLMALDPENFSGAVLIFGSSPREYEHAFILALQAAFSLTVSSYRCIMFHAAAVQWNKNAYLFPGISGAGKSTLVSSFPQKSRLADDGICCRCTGAGYRLFPTPFTQNISPFQTEKGIPLKKIFFPVQHSSTYSRSLSPEAALCEILHHHIHFFRYFPAEQAGQTFDTAADLVRQIPAYYFYFTKSFDYAAFIQADFQ